MLIGEDEINENVVALKDMRSGTQQKLSIEDASELIKRDMEQRSKAPVIKEDK